MKKIFIATCCIITIASCSKKSVPSKPNYSLNNHNNNNTEIKPIDSVATENNISIDSMNASPKTMAVMVVADGYGRLITSKESLPPEAGIKYNALQLSKGFTAQQRNNLQTRYHMVPPRVLYVTQEYSQHSLKGNYYIYRKKFWYWKKSDGLYYLDQKYYL